MHPTCPSSPDDIARNVSHPAHIEDVLDAISWLQKEYSIGEQYVLVGHSCGATLAFQAVMGGWYSTMGITSSSDNFKMPCAIVGVEGIYDQFQLKESYKKSEFAAIYREFLEGAFGEDETEWYKASPSNADFTHSWPNGRLIVLAWSKDDELVDERQLFIMRRSLQEQKNEKRTDMIVHVSGNHDEIWQNGTQLANVVKFALRRLEGLASPDITIASD